ncbi:GAF domain-containing protein [Actinomadura sp. 7K534]|uniref:helix-turn-helix domain-containing protein n=1 Tax=Actinomadura sp. 7K534 TaxID=2530366 RepID=UPI001053CE5D|nr:GAF domain-containing protein [Actinomadura sp. 7K534]TDB94424.1 GAF domain-containing protein [Actinomadura sp. 7K534]
MNWAVTLNPTTTPTPAAVFLDLLAREASPAEFEGPLVAARAAGAGPETLAELEAAQLAALRVRAIMQRYARREAELAALFDTAGDLAALRDHDAILEAIVHRARRLLNADIAYMTLNDDYMADGGRPGGGEGGDTCMRVTDGAVSAAFRRLRVPLGDGLGGLVAQTAMPYSTDHYLKDPQFRHRTFIDEAVAEEGLVAILGVPMRTGSRVIGVLYAANRSERPFDQEKAVLLGSLAAHAAVAIDNARLLQETRAALAELSRTAAKDRARGAAVERAAQAHDRITALVVRGGGAGEVAAVVTEVLGGSLHILDAGGRPVAASGDPAPLGEDECSAVMAAAHSARTRGRAVRRGDLWVASVTTGDEVLGALVLRTAAEVSDADRRILERAALVTALLMLLRHSATEAEGRVRGELLDDLLGGRVDGTGAAEARARKVNVDLTAAHVVLVARCPSPEQRRRAAFWAASHAAVSHGLAAVHGEEVVLLLPGDEPGEAAKRVAKELGAALAEPAAVGAAGPVRDPARVPAAHREARRCADALVALGRRDGAADARELGFVGLLIGADRDVGGFLRATLGPVLDYDARRGTSLVRTMEGYFDAGGSPSRTAERLHIHVNTVNQRLNRVGRLLGADWQEPGRALEIRLALRLQHLQGPQG